MSDFCNYVLIQDPDVRRVSEQLQHALLDVGVKVVPPETAGAHHATLRALRNGHIVLWFDDDWHPFDRPLARPLSGRLGSAVASCFLHGRAEVEAVTLYQAGEPLASYLITDAPEQWKVARVGKPVFRLELEGRAPTDDEDAQYDAQLAALRKAQHKTFKSLPFAALLRGTRWHDLLPEAQAGSGPVISLSILDEAEHLAPVRRFEQDVLRALETILPELPLVRTKPDSAGAIALARNYPTRRLRLEFRSHGTDEFETVTVNVDWFALDVERAAWLPTGQRFTLVDGAPTSEFSTALAREVPVLELFAPELHAELEQRGLSRLKGKVEAGVDEAQATARFVDTGQQLYDSALADRARGKERACRALLRYLVEHYPGHPRAADARQLLSTPVRGWKRFFLR